MSQPEQVAYWQHQARKHENRVQAMGDYDQVKADAQKYQDMVTAQQSQHERAVADARRQGHADAIAAAGDQLVEQWVRAAAYQRLDEERVNALLGGMNRKAFINAQGAVDTAKVYEFVNAAAPAQQAPPLPPAAVPPTGQQPTPTPAPQLPQPVPVFVPPTGSPDFGQGQPRTATPSGLEAGREIARQRFGQPGAATPTR